MLETNQLPVRVPDDSLLGEGGLLSIPQARNLIAHKLEESYDLAALSLVSRRCLKAANNAIRKLDVRSIPRDLQDEFLERLLNRFDNLRTLVWGRERVIEVNEWTRAYSFDPMVRLRGGGENCSAGSFLRS
jgi:hypothetical protein